MRLIFMGYHNVGYYCLEALIDLCREYGDEIAAVVTHADDPGESIWFASVRDLAFNHYLPVYQPDNPNDPDFVRAMAKLQPDFLFSVYYRHMLKRPMLELPRLGALNLHGSLLPRYRGRCPHNWVLINGETETGVTLHYMAPKADQGDIVAQRCVPIALDDTAATLLARLTAAGEDLMRETYPLLRHGQAPRMQQDHNDASYYGGRRPADGLIDWARPAFEIYNLIRAVTHPYPGAFTYYRGKKLFIWRGQPIKAAASAAHAPAPPGRVLTGLPGHGLLVATGDGHFLVQEAQWEGEPEFSGPILATWRHLVGERLG
ncbi:MAG: formyltransferase [Deltaproteobacteria bacterium]|nr:formyltransferase [Deltaproteobacteria bacterium]